MTSISIVSIVIDAMIFGRCPIRWLLFDTRSFEYNRPMRKMIDSSHIAWYIQVSEYTEASMTYTASAEGQLWRQAYNNYYYY